MKILFIGARLFDDIALYAKNEGITSVLTESNPDSPNLKLSDTYHIVPRGMEAPKEIAIKEDVDAVLPLIGIDKPLVEVAKLKKDLEENYGIPVIASPLESVITARDKLKTKEFFEKNRINTPAFCKISKNGKKPQLPAVMKKLEGQGGSGVKIVLNDEDYENVLPDFEDAFAEKFIEGTEISIEVLRYHGKTVPLVPVCKGKTTNECIHPLDKLKTAPLNINGLNNEEIRKKACMIANSLGAEGVIDIDIIFDENEKISYFIEINTRPSGTRYLTAASTNISPMHELVDMATGEWNYMEVEKRIKNFSAIEIPIGDYKTKKNNFNYRRFDGSDSYIIHGPENFQRITIRAETLEKAFSTAEKLNIDYKKFQ
ncbi:MAG TPA: ATP-grasp domain-containing protein [Methanobacterium sp.]|nr:ATP-grasp domain-containing protein [Methanobacterium sp.]